MSSIPQADTETALAGAVGPFTGFGNFFRKELGDWWKSWRFLIVLIVMTVIAEFIVFFTYDLAGRFRRDFQGQIELPSEQLVVTISALGSLNPHAPGIVLQILIIIFSTMGIMAVEKSSGTLAWSLTKPLGRTGLLVAKWLAATMMLWLAMCVVPILISTISISAYYGINPYFDKMAPVVGSAFAWIALWVLLSLTISLGFRSQAAVAGILVAFWLVPYIFGVLMGRCWGTKRCIGSSIVWPPARRSGPTVWSPTMICS